MSLRSADSATSSFFISGLLKRSTGLARESSSVFSCILGWWLTLRTTLSLKCYSMKYYFIAGEASGDLHGSNTIKEILKLDSGAQFAFTGGDLMEKATGVKAHIHIKQMAFMGFVDVLKNIGAIR